MYNGYAERSPMGKKHTSYRISEEGKQCIQLLARLLGVREMAEKKGVKFEQSHTTGPTVSNG